MCLPFSLSQRAKNSQKEGGLVSTNEMVSGIIISAVNSTDSIEEVAHVDNS